MDPKNYVKWNAIVAVAIGILGVALGVALAVSTTNMVAGVCLALVGCGAVATGLWASRRRR